MPSGELTVGIRLHPNQRSPVPFHFHPGTCYVHRPELQKNVPGHPSKPGRGGANSGTYKGTVLPRQFQTEPREPTSRRSPGWTDPPHQPFKVQSRQAVPAAPGSLGFRWNPGQGFPHSLTSPGAYTATQLQLSSCPRRSHPTPRSGGVLGTRHMLYPQLCDSPPLTFFLEEPALVRQDFCRAR